jgi:hypothetical protein
VAAGAQRLAQPQRRDQLLDEEGRAHGAVVDRAGEGGGGRFGQERVQQGGDAVAVERVERELLEPAAAAQLVAQPAQAVAAGEAVGAVGADDQHRHLLQRPGQRGDQFQGRLVGPLQVVEQDRQRPLGGEVGEGAAHRLEDRRPLGLGGGLAELGK